MLIKNCKVFLTKLDWQEYVDSVSDNSPFVIGDTVSSNDIIRMKKAKFRPCKGYSNRPFKDKLAY